MQEKHEITIKTDNMQFTYKMYKDCINYLWHFVNDCADCLSPQGLSCIPIVKEFQKKRGTIVNSWLLCSILNDEKQHLTESDRKALIRLMKRIEREYTKSGI